MSVRALAVAVLPGGRRGRQQGWGLALLIKPGTSGGKGGPCPFHHGLWFSWVWPCLEPAGLR